ncbi:MAG: hypothetical protein AABY93_03700 [Bacteroidota bacterium]
MTRLIFLFVIVGLSKIAVAQVSNNNIQNRLTLEINSDPIFSSTAKTNVEWTCINKALTNKCLVYHNDQWFNFSVPTAGTYFINFSSQKCRDLRGLQLIIIEGNPCETTTYRILRCLPQIPQDDIFVQLDSLKSKIKYLLNIDGFLGDFCEFGIQIGEKPNGLPRTYQTLDTIKAEIIRNGRMINLVWEVSQDKIDQLQSFKVYRAQSTGLKSDFIRQQPVSRNSYGTYVLKYSISDSLQKEGTYVYHIFGIEKLTQVPFLLVEKIVEYAELKPIEPKQRVARLNLSFKDMTVFKVVVYDDVAHAMLRKLSVEFEEERDHTFEVDLEEFIDRGIKKFMILVSDGSAQGGFEFYYNIDEKGQLIQE